MVTYAHDITQSGQEPTFARNTQGVVVGWACATAKVPENTLQWLVRQCEDQMLVLRATACHAAEDDPTNLKRCRRGEGNDRMRIEPVVDATKQAFLAAVDRGVFNTADHYFLWLWQHVPPVEALDLLLTVAIPKNVLDDHYFSCPAFTWRAVEWIG